MFSGAQPLFTNPCHLCVTHIYVEKPGFEPGMVHVLVLRSIALALPLFQRLPISPLLPSVFPECQHYEPPCRHRQLPDDFVGIHLD